MRDFGHAGDKFFQFVVRKKQRITARKKDVADLRRFFEIFNRTIPLHFQFLVRNARNDTRARAISAVRSAAVGHQKKDAIRVAMDEARHWHVGIFAARIGHFRRIGVGFFDARDHLPANRAIGIGGMDEVEKMGRDGSRELRASEQNARALFLAQSQVALDLLKRLHAVFQLPLRRIPVVGRDVLTGPVARSVRDESRCVGNQDGVILERIVNLSKGGLTKFAVNGC